MNSTSRETPQDAGAPATLVRVVRQGMCAGLLVGAILGCVEALRVVAALSESTRTTGELGRLAAAVLLGYLALGWFLGICAALILPRRMRGLPPLAGLLALLALVEVIARTWPTPVQAWGISDIGLRGAQAYVAAVAVLAAAAGLVAGHVIARRVSIESLRLSGALALGGVVTAGGAAAAYVLLSREVAGKAVPIIVAIAAGAALAGAAFVAGRYALSRRMWGAGWGAALVATGVLSAIAAGVTWEAGARSRPNVILLTIDALRADAVGCCGAKAGATPSIDALAREGITFPAAFAHAPWTPPSLTSLMTGAYASEQGTGRDPRQVAYDFSRAHARAEATTLAEALSGAGYNTAAVLTNPWLERTFGLGAGIAWHCHSTAGVSVEAEARPWCYRSACGRILNWLWPAVSKPYLDRRLRAVPPSWRTDAKEINARVRHWLDQQQAQPFFLWAHYIDPHDPYCPLSDPVWRDAVVGPDKSPLRRIQTWHSINRGGISLTDAERALIQRLYRAEVREADAAVGEVLGWLKERGLYDNALIIITADHGEELFDHGRMAHAQSMYDELLHVPLIVKLPRGDAAGTQVGAQVRLIDVYPTLCDICDLRRPAGLRGRSLMPLIAGPGDSADRPLYAEAIRLGPERKALRAGRYKLIVEPATGEWEAYDLERDPGEHHNVIAQDASQLAPLRRDLEDWSRRMTAAHRRVFRGAERVKLDEGTIRQLQALGYLQAPPGK